MAARIMPGVQMPHCAAPYSRNARWTACSVSPLATPSIVVIEAPSTCNTGTRQEFTSSPSISTEQAPHSPSPQPSLTPVSRRSSLNTSRSRDMGGASMECSTPFMFTRKQALHHQLRDQRDLVKSHARRVFDGVEDRRRDAVHRQFPDSLGARGPVCVRIL